MSDLQVGLEQSVLASCDAVGSPVRAHVVGVKFWNRRWLNMLLLQKLGLPPVFYDDFELALKMLSESGGLKNNQLIVWASSLTEEQKRITRDRKGWFLEDGFIRSVGLGAGLNPGFSFVLDQRGIYYASEPQSDLECLLQNASLDDAELLRGQQLRQVLQEQKISKYNLSSGDNFNPVSGEKKRLLVVGQVRNDASITSNISPSLGTVPDSNINLALLRFSRQTNPDAYIIYKPHPDVCNGLRPGAVSPEQSQSFADQVVTDTGILPLIEWCQELHTISSLAGFEALVRNKQVVTHGAPFYAGWGLTRDYSSFPRRTNLLSIDALVYVLLIQYSCYINPLSKRLCQPEALIAYLAQQKVKRRVQWRARVLTLISWIGRKLGL